MQDLRAAIRSAGLRATPARLSVLRALQAAGAPLSHAQLMDELPDLERATLYRNLADLAEAGLLTRERLDGVLRFRAGVHGRHPHLVCVECGGVDCLSPTSVTLARNLRRAVDEVELRGRCRGCR